MIFLSYSGSMRWRTKAGDEISARLGEPLTKDMTAQAWRTALDPNGEWIPTVLAAADRRLTEVRRAVPDAGAMVIATDQTDARAYAGHLARLTGKSPTVVLSDDDGASDRIDEFSAGDSRWMVAVRMVSEGVDVPRLAVGVYATQHRDAAVLRAGRRPVRARAPARRDGVGVPAERPAAARARQHARGRARPRAGPPEDRRGAGRRVNPEDALLEAANRERNGADELGPDGKQGSFEALEAQASFDRVLFDGGEFGTGAEIGSEEELDFLGLPGLLDADQVTVLLRQRQADQLSGRKKGRRDGGGAAEWTTAGRPSCARSSALVGAWARKSGQPHGSVHTELRRRCGGPEVAARGPGPADRAGRDGPRLVRRQEVSHLRPARTLARLTSWTGGFARGSHHAHILTEFIAQVRALDARPLSRAGPAQLGAQRADAGERCHG